LVGSTNSYSTTSLSQLRTFKLEITSYVAPYLFKQTEITMLNYSDIKNYWSKFYADAFEDAKSFWKNYADTVEKFYKK
jgi:hypothetical protein